MSTWRDIIAGAGDEAEFRVAVRGGHDFLLLPADRRCTAQALELYPAQTARARLVRVALGIALRFGLPVPLRRERLALDPALLPGVDCIAVLCGNPAAAGRRFVVLGFRGGEPAAVLKTGTTPEARALILREAEFLRANMEKPGLPVLRSVDDGARRAAFSTDFAPGRPPADDAGIAAILGAWVADENVPLGEIPGWRRIAGIPGPWQAHAAAKVAPVLFHGDFAPWNIRVHRGAWMALDWERGESRGVPGWDWMHYIIQREVLVRKAAPQRTLDTMLGVMESAAWRDYVRRTGIVEIQRVILAGYLAHAAHVQRQTEGADAITAMLALASRL